MTQLFTFGITEKNLVLTKEYKNLKLYFEWENCIIESTGDRNIKITATTELKEYDSSHETNRYLRPIFISVFDILSFFLDEYIHVGSSSSSSSMKLPKKELLTTKKEVIFSYEGVKELENSHMLYPVEERTELNVDFTNDLIKVLNKLAHDKELIITILEKLRSNNALFFQTEDYYDQVYLNYFNIIELLANRCAKELKKELRKNLETLLNSFYSESLFYSNNAKQSKINEKKKVLNDVIVREEVNTKNQIAFFFKKMEIEIPQPMSYIKNMCLNRNKVAHGNIVYNEKVIWPLPATFKALDESHLKCYEMYLLTNYLTCSYLGLDYKKNFEASLFINLSYPKEVLLDMIEGTLTLPSSEQLINGGEKTLNYRSIADILVKESINKQKCIDINNVAELIKEPFLNVDIKEENANMILILSILLADSSDNQVSETAQDYALKIIEYSWFSEHSNRKDYLRYLELYNCKVKWYKEAIENSKI